MPFARSYRLVCRFLALVVPLGLSLPAVVAMEPSAEQLEFFEKQVRPILAERCYECHSAASRRLEAGLRLDSRQGALQGGDSGPAIVLGEPDESLLIDAVRYESFEMPPRGKLSDDQVKELVQWIASGAAWPQDVTKPEEHAAGQFDLEERKSQHWAWRPIHRQTPACVEDESWPRNAIDHFILQRLEAAGLQPAEQADRRTLVRRLYFDLIGLPPSPEQVREFLEDGAEDAYERLVDRLLTSKHFGEKWARHWMDLVRYAETHGHEFDYPIHHAWQFRDYLVRAFNADLPYDQFITEHLAGDLLENPRKHPVEGFKESIIGTGFWFLGEAVHAPTDVRGDEAIRVDNQIDVMTKTFLGLTVGCARCHNHKFDPISTEDYYALAGFLQSSRRQEAMLDPHGRIAQTASALRELCSAGDVWMRETVTTRLPGQATFAKRLLAAAVLADTEEKAEGERSANIHSRLATVLQGPAVSRPTHPLYAWAHLAVADGAAGDFTANRDRLRDELNTQAQQAEKHAAESVLLADFDDAILDGAGLDDWSSTGEAFAPVATSGGQWDATGRVVRLVRPGLAHSGLASPKLHGVLRSPTFTITHPNIHYRLLASGVQIRLIIDGYFMDVFSALLFRGVTLNNVDTAGEFRWQTQSGDLRNYIGRTAHIEILDHGDGYVALDQVRLSAGGTPAEVPNRLNLAVLSDPSVNSLDDLALSYGRLLQAAVACASRGEADADQVAFLNLVLNTQKPTTDTSPLDQLAQRMEEAEAGLPAPVRVLAITDGTGQDERVHIRGSHANLGDRVPRRLLTAIAGEDQPPITAGSGRLELAHRITDGANPFPSRVLVNRLWHHLFGRGIVPSVDDFGVMGQPPSHPELLDWLAADFMRNDWSIKHAIRRMVTSRTYRMASNVERSDSKAQRIDPTNALLHRMRIRRLPAESIRDAMLAVSGRLDRKMFGVSVPVHLTAFMQGRGRPKGGPLDGQGRRSVYIEVRRNFLSPMMLAFDMSSPFNTMGRRSVSNVPAQSLILMNDPFVVDQAKRWAERLQTEFATTDDRLDVMFQQAMACPPTQHQLERSKAFLESQAAMYGTTADDLRVWTDLCHTVMNMKAFIYLN